MRFPRSIRCLKMKRARRSTAWVGDLIEDARFNFTSYAECFISENLVRKLVEETGTVLSKEAKEEVDKWRAKERRTKTKETSVSA